jgi:predicted metal-dependent phosphoesterase TrpH
MLGLFVDDANDELIKCTNQSCRFRRQRAVEIVERLNSLGIDVEFTAVESAAGCGSIGRPHIAQALVEHGATATIDEAFRRFIGIGRPAFVPKLTVGAEEVISVVHRAGGVAILAHPASSRVRPDEIGTLAELGLDGFELVHPKHTSNARKKLERLIDDMGLLPSGGSDFHGPGVGTTRLGEYAVSLQWLEALREAATSHRANTLSTEENA